MFTRIASIGMAMLLVAGATGCKSDPGRERTKATVGTIQDTRAEMAAGIGEIEAVQATIIALQNTAGDQVGLYNTYKKQVAAVETRSERVGEAADDMARRSQEYRQAWQQEAGQISDPALRDAAQARAAAVRDRLTNVFENYRIAKNAYYPFVAKLKDVQTFLSNDLTAGGVKAATPSLQDAVKLGDDLKAKTKVVISDLDAASARLSPATQPR